MDIPGGRRPPSSFENSAGLRVSDKGKSIAYVRSSSTALSVSRSVIVRTNVGITEKMAAVTVADDAQIVGSSAVLVGCRGCSNLSFQSDAVRFDLSEPTLADDMKLASEQPKEAEVGRRSRRSVSSSSLATAKSRGPY